MRTECLLAAGIKQRLSNAPLERDVSPGSRSLCSACPPDPGAEPLTIAPSERAAGRENMAVMLRGVYLTSLPSQRGQIDDILCSPPPASSSGWAAVR